jgi:hypothetical protein
MALCTGNAVEIGLLLDVHAATGIDGIGQVDLKVRQNRHQPLHDLGPKADAVLGAVTRRLRRDGRLIGERECGHDLPERPPLAAVRAFDEAA